MNFKDCQIQGFKENKCGAITFSVKIKREDYTDCDRDMIKEIWRHDGAVDVDVDLSDQSEPVCLPGHNETLSSLSKLTVKPERSIWQRIRDAHNSHNTNYHEQWKKDSGALHTNEYFGNNTELAQAYLKNFRKLYLGEY